MKLINAEGQEVEVDVSDKFETGSIIEINYPIHLGQIFTFQENNKVFTAQAKYLTKEDVKNMLMGFSVNSIFVEIISQREATSND